MLSRRGFFAGLASSLAAPAIIKTGILMPVRVITPRSPILTIAEITRESVRLWVNTNKFLAEIDRQYELRETSTLHVNSFTGVLRKGDIITFSPSLIS